MDYGIADLMLAEGAYRRALATLVAAHRRYERAITATARAAAVSDANAIAHAEGLVLCARSALGSAYVAVVDNERRLNVMQASADPRCAYWRDERVHGKCRRELAYLTADVARLTAEVDRLRGAK